MCQNSFAFTQASGPSAGCRTPTAPRLWLSQMAPLSELKQHGTRRDRSQCLPWGRGGDGLRRPLLAPGQRGRAPVPAPGPQLGLWKDKLPLWSHPGPGYVHPGSWPVLVQHNTPSAKFSLHHHPDRQGLAPGTCQRQECGHAPAEAGASQGRLLVSQDVQLFLALSEEALESQVLPDDWQQLLQQLPLPQTHYC